MRDRIKADIQRIISFLLMLAILLPSELAWAALGDPTVLPNFRSYLYRQQYNQSDPTEGLIQGNNNEISFTNPKPLYYVIQKDELVNEDDPNHVNIVEGQTYQVPLPEPLVCYRDINNEPVYHSEGFVFARINTTKGDDYIQIKFQIEGGGHDLSELTDVHFSVSCMLDQQKADDMDTDGDGQITIDTQPTPTDVIIDELKPAPPVETTLTKTAQTNGTETTWTVQCNVGNKEGNIPNRLVGTLPVGLDYVADSASVTPAGDAPVYNPDTRTLEYDLPADAQTVTMTYKTTLSPTVLTQFWQDGKQPSFTNRAQAKDGETVCATATQTVKYPLSPLLKKSSIDIDYDENEKKYFATWGITVDTKGQNLTALTLQDTYGQALKLDGDFSKWEMKLTYVDPDQPDPHIDIQEADITSDPDARSLTIHLQPYLAQMSSFPGQPFQLRYKMEIDRTALEQGAAQEWFRNQASAGFQTDKMPQPANSVISTADLPVKTENTLLTQEGKGYNKQTRALQWKSTINPGLGIDGMAVNMTKAVYEDRFTAGGQNGYEDQTFGLDEAARQAQVDSIKQQIEQQFEKNNLTDATVKVSITEDDTARVLRVELENTGTETISFEYNTYLINPKHWAANVNLNFRNQVKLLKDETQISGVPTTKDATASAYVTVSLTVLRKWPMWTYYTDTNRLHWEIELDRSAASLGTVRVTDTLPDGVTYVPGSATIGGQPIAETDTGGDYVSVEGNQLVFYLKNVSTQKDIQFYATVDTNASEFLQKQEKAFRNTAKLEVFDNGQWVQTATAQETARLKYAILQKTAKLTEGAEKGVQEAQYTVQINPMRTELASAEGKTVVVQDTLADGLVLDLESVKLYQGVTPSVNKTNDTTHVYTPVINAGEALEAEPQFDAVLNQLEVPLPASDQPYVLTYTAYVTRTGVDLDNQVRLLHTNAADNMGADNETVKHMTVGGGASLRPPKNRYCSVLLKKVDSSTNQALEGAEFGLYSDQSEEALLAIGVSGTDGVCTLSVPKSAVAGLDTLYYKELRAPDGYLVGNNHDWTPITMDEVNASADAPIEVANTKAQNNQLGRLHIVRQDENTKEPLAGAEFTLYDADGLVVTYGVTNLRGELDFDGLKPDAEYTLKETDPPVGYPPIEPQEVQAMQEPEATVVENAVTLVSCTITKTDTDTAALLSGATFGLYDTADCSGTPLQSKTTDATGTCTFSNLDPREKYWVRELQPPEGYLASDTIHTLNLSAEQDIRLPISNTKDSSSGGDGGDEGDGGSSGGSGGGGGGGGGGSVSRYTLTYDLGYENLREQETYAAGTRVDLDWTPARDGYSFTVWYTDAAGTTRVTAVTMDRNRTVYAGWKKYTVPDTLNDEDHFAYIVGYPDGNVHPEWNITRGEVAAVFFRLLDPDVRTQNLTWDCTFTDVPLNSWHRSSIATMQAMGIVSEHNAQAFRPDVPITRAEFAAMASRFDTSDLEPSGTFSDIGGHWAEEEIRRAAALGWVRGYEDGTFRPDQYITRAEAMTLVNHMLLRLPETPDDLLEDMIHWPDNADPQFWSYLAVQEATNSHDCQRKPDGVYETWTALTPNEDWFQYNHNPAC